MTDRYAALIVTLEDDIREDDPRLEALMAAVGQLRGVLNVTPYQTNPDIWIGRSRARHDLINKVLDALKEDVNPSKL